MQRCCSCLCNKEFQVYSRVNSCYPSDNRTDPVSVRVRDLITWGNHNVDRLSSVSEIIAERIRTDIRQENYNSVAVGTKIYAKILENSKETNLNLSPAFANVILLLVQTQKANYIAIATDATQNLYKFSTPQSIQNQVTRIVRAYLKLADIEELSDIIYEGLSKIILRSSVENIPIDEILNNIKDKIETKPATKEVLASLSRAVSPLSTPRFAKRLFQFFDSAHLWNDIQYLELLMRIIISEMPEKNSQLLFKLWLEQLPPNKSDVGHCRTIINVSIYLFEQLPLKSLLFQTDALTIIVSFSCELINLLYEDKETIQENCFSLVHSITKYFSQSDLFKVANKELWKLLPGKENNRSTAISFEQIILFFKFAIIFNDSVQEMLTKKMINGNCQRILAFMLKYDLSSSILQIMLEYFKSLNSVCPTVGIDCEISFLLVLQKEIKTMNQEKNIQLNTFIMCAMFDIAQINSSIKEYVDEICKSRLKVKPPMCDLSLNFVKDYFPEVQKNPVGAKSGCITILFKKKELIKNLFESKQSILKLMMEIRQSDANVVTDVNVVNEEEDIEYSQGLNFDHHQDFVNCIDQEEYDMSDTNSSEQPMDLKEAMKQQQNKHAHRNGIYNEIGSISLEWKSSLNNSKKNPTKQYQ